MFTYIATKRSVRVGGAGVYSKLLCTLVWGRTSLHIMHLQIRVGRGGEKRDKKFQNDQKSILLITNIYIFIHI